jgi:RNA polymerase sigma-70 factor (ECF subfamily)
LKTSDKYLTVGVIERDMIKNDEHTLKVQQLFVRHQGQLKAFIVALCPGFARADDVLQEVFLTVTAKAHEFDLDSNFSAWVRAIARFKVLEARRRSGHQSLSSHVLESLAASCPDEWGNEERLNAMAECMGVLAPRAKELVQLRYQREHSPTEIARMLSRSLNSVNVALSKARLLLRECMSRQLDGQGA